LWPPAGGLTALSRVFGFFRDVLLAERAFNPEFAPLFSKRLRTKEALAGGKRRPDRENRWVSNRI
jgi:hypothetical protein